MNVHGYLVDLPAKPTPWDVPYTCANCGGAAEAWVFARMGKKMHARGFLRVAYCHACHGNVWKMTRLESGVLGGCAVGGVVLGLLGLAAPWLPAVVAMAVPALVAVGIAFAVVRRFPWSAVTAPRTSQGDAVWITDASNPGLLCTNKAWAESFASHNGLAPPRQDVIKRSQSPVLAALLGGWTALAVSVVAFLWTHPAVHVDNPTGDPILFWVDGKPKSIVHGTESFHLLRGAHTLGWSGPDAPLPSSTIPVDLGGGTYLYSPGARGCYWRQVTVYRNGLHESVDTGFFGAEAADLVDGPLEVKEFYSFSEVSNWFEPNPRSIDKRWSQSNVRIAIRRNGPCTRLAVKGCGNPILSMLLDCQRKANSPAEVDRCVLQARRRCSGADQ